MHERIVGSFLQVSVWQPENCRKLRCLYYVTCEKQVQMWEHLHLVLGIQSQQLRNQVQRHGCMTEGCSAIFEWSSATGLRCIKAHADTPVRTHLNQPLQVTCCNTFQINFIRNRWMAQSRHSLQSHRWCTLEALNPWSIHFIKIVLVIHIQRQSEPDQSQECDPPLQTLSLLGRVIEMQVKRRKFLPCELLQIQARVQIMEASGTKWTHRDYNQLQQEIGMHCPCVRNKVLQIRRSLKREVSDCFLCVSGNVCRLSSALFEEISTWWCFRWTIPQQTNHNPLPAQKYSPALQQESKASRLHRFDVVVVILWPKSLTLTMALETQAQRADGQLYLPSDTAGYSREARRFGMWRWKLVIFNIHHCHRPINTLVTIHMKL